MNAEVRKEQGKDTNCRLRVVNRFPAVIYGGREAPLVVKLGHDRIMNMQVKAEFYSEVLTTVVDSKEIKVKAQDVQRHLYRPRLLYVDFACA